MHMNLRPLSLAPAHAPACACMCACMGLTPGEIF